MPGFVSTSQQVETQLRANLRQKDRSLEHITAHCQNVVKASPLRGFIIQIRDKMDLKPNLKWKQMQFQLTEVDDALLRYV